MKLTENFTGYSSDPDMTPFEKAQTSAFLFSARAYFMTQFMELIEEWEALQVVIEDVTECDMTDAEKAIALKFLDAENLRLEDMFAMASEAWYKKFKVEA